mmetsp:Transcript_38977/g.62886  ORF Transcript_38977/g.62886 Transcript_38977/m.62886 type:complete len:663 (+) Transcript_38977:369-2357(+)
MRRRTVKLLMEEDENVEESTRQLGLSSVSMELMAEAAKINHAVVDPSGDNQEELVFKNHKYVFVGSSLHREHNLTGEKQVVIDLDRLEKEIFNTPCEESSPQIVDVKISPCENYVAFTLRLNESDEWVSMFVVNATSGELIRNIRVDRVHSVCWVPHAMSGVYWLYFTQVDHLSRPWQVSRVALNGSSTEIVYQENDDSFFLDVAVTKDEKYLLVNTNSKSTSEVHVSAIKDCSLPRSLVCLQERTPGLQYFVEHAGERFWIVTNFGDADGNFQLYSTSDSTFSGKDEWEHCRCSNVGFSVEELDVFKEFVVSFERSTTSGKQLVRVIDLEGNELYHFGDRLEAVSTIDPCQNPDFNASTFQVTLCSPICPDFTHTLGRTDAGKVLPRKQVGKDLCLEEKLIGEVPVTLFYKRDLVSMDGMNPLLVLSYGAYGHNLPSRFDPCNVSLVNRGWVIAYAHVRGGGELGRQWYQRGKLLEKRNTVQDIVNIVTTLQSEGWSNPQLSAAQAMSAGALPLGVIANEHPELFRAMVLDVPFLDVYDSMHDESLPLTIAEYEEWGNPAVDPIVDEYIRAYDPVQNVGSARTKMPSILIRCSLSDIRVGYWGPCKYVTKLRSTLQGTSRMPDKLLLKWAVDDSHHAGDRVEEKAFGHAFLIKCCTQDRTN